MSKKSLNALFVSYKPPGRGSNKHLSLLKRKYHVKKAGFSGTLDPFAKGVLIVAFGNYTRLFRFLAKTPKEYVATLWLGAQSPTLDLEGVCSIKEPSPLSVEAIRTTLHSFEGSFTYTPPSYSAKKIAGQRAYTLAREHKEVQLKQVTSTIYSTELLQYNHPFITFRASVSEGTYIRSLGVEIARKLGVDGACLSALHRVSEGKLSYNNEIFLDIRKCLNIPQNYYKKSPDDFNDGKKLHVEDFDTKDDGCYWIDNQKFLSVVRIENAKVYYELNKVELC